jgi:Uma2 family endonuclease
MSALQHRLRMTEAEYLEYDRTHEGKHEFFDGYLVPWNGEVLGMAGGSPEHSLLGSAILAALHGAARRKKCRAFNPDIRVRVPSGRYVYPDATVACDPRYDDSNPRTLLNPLLVVEVASPSTVDKDRTTKLSAYTSMDSVHAYWLFESNRAFVTLYERRDEFWSLRTLSGLDATLDSPLFDEPFALADLYADLDLTSEEEL